MSERVGSDSSLVISYLTLRKVIGLLGTSFPFILSLGAVVIAGTGVQRSISDYYYTRMGDVFVGTLCVIGFFLLSYRGYERADNIAGDLACIFAVGVALFPTHETPGEKGAVGYLHLTFAALFFATLIYFSLFLFTKTDPSRSPSRRKLQRNGVYRTCGYTMAASILLIFVTFLLPEPVGQRVAAFNPVFWLESIAIVAFGVSWLTKGEAILKDEE